ncbi:hypothetical protein [Bradyrhizobium sp. CER78]|uniref:hypothetical protein n=1 Tax=Bradyrhizobium sp. CER78 TaxID=3039162 RepID=UPI002448DBCE|nr:hypothetical protein [Bradyrhizobium sp. CER78]MDH2387043.1 hypothetical protein [Bradyrhizobium sp. CER78]
MKTVTLAAALSLLFASSTLCRANSSPWCAADVAILNFKNYKGQDLAKIEIRSLKAVCDRNPEKKVFGVNLERSMRIEHNGRWTDVPKACLSGFSFAMDGLALEGDDHGLGISLIGKSPDNDERVKRSIYKLGDEISCYQIERYPNVDDQDHEIREYNRDLQ